MLPLVMKNVLKVACRQGLHDKNCNFFKIQDGGRPPFWKSWISVFWP